MWLGKTGQSDERIFCLTAAKDAFAGSRMLRDLLRQKGFVIGRLRVASLMKKMAIDAIYRWPNTSKPTPGHKV